MHGKGNDKYDNVRIGINSRLDTIQAAVLIEKLSEFPIELISRNKVAESYSTDLKTTGETPYVPEGYLSSWAQYTLVSENRNRIMVEYKAKGIPTMVYYGTCMHQQTAFKELGYRNGDFPVAEHLSKCVLSLPMHGYLNKSNFDVFLKTDKII